MGSSITSPIVYYTILLVIFLYLIDFYCEILAFIVEFMINFTFYIMIVLVIEMSNFEVMVIFNKMLDNTREIKMNTKLSYAINRLIIDKNEQ